MAARFLTSKCQPTCRSTLNACTRSRSVVGAGDPQCFRRMVYALYDGESALGRPTIGKKQSAREYFLRCERSPPDYTRIWGVTRCALCSVPRSGIPKTRLPSCAPHTCRKSAKYRYNQVHQMPTFVNAMPMCAVCNIIS